MNRIQERELHRMLDKSMRLLKYADERVKESEMTQKQAILKRLKQGKSVDCVLAEKLFGCHRLAARIMELRSEGHDIKTTMVDFVGKYGNPGKYARYSLVR